MDKKLGLEHTIRNIMNESVGVSGTDKFTKTGNSFFKSFHAEPKKGDTHPDGNAVRAARNVSKERTSETISKVTEEEQIDEFVAPPIKVKVRPPSIPEIPVPKVEPKVPAPVEAPAPAPKPAPAPGPAQTPAPAPAPGPAQTPAPAPAPAPKPAQTTQPAPAPAPKPAQTTQPAPAPAPGLAPKPAPGSPPAPKVNTKIQTKSPKNKLRFPIMPFPLAIHPLGGAHGRAPVNIHLHTPQERFGESTEADNVRRSIENVARPNSKNKLTKQAELKTKIIDETTKKANIVRDAVKEKKGGQNPLVDTKPKLKGLEIDEGKRLNSFVRTTGVLGAGGGVGAAGGVEKAQRTMDSQTQYDQETGQINPEKSSFAKFLDKYNPLYDPEKAKTGPTGVDYALDVGQMAVTPFITVPSGASAVYRDLQRGDYTDAVLDTVGMAPFGSQAIKAPAWIASKAGSLISKIPGLSSSGKKIVSAGEKLGSSKIANPRQHGFRDTAATAASGAELGNLGKQFTSVAGERAKENKTSTMQELPGVAKDYGKVWASEVQKGGTDIYKNVLDYAKKIK